MPHSRGLRSGELVARDETHVATLPQLQLHREHDIGDHEGVLEKKTSDLAVLNARVKSIWGERIELAQMQKATTAQTVDKGSRSGFMTIIELARKTLQVSVMIQLLESSNDLPATAGDQSTI